MKTFYEWLLNEKITNTVKGPFLLYHGSDTGNNNAVLNSFKQEGAKPIGGGHGQGGGFFVTTSLKIAKNHAISRNKGEIGLYNTKVEGNPMVVVVEVPEMDFNQWDLDLEYHGQEVASYVAKNLDKVKQLGQITPSKSTINYLMKDDPGSERLEPLAKDNPEKLEFDKNVGKHPRTISFRKKKGDIGGDTVAIPYKGAIGYKPATLDPLRASQLAPWYYTHQDASQGRHQRLEALFFKKRYGKIPMLLKYTGQEPIPVKEILVYDGQNWIPN